MEKQKFKIINAATATEKTTGVGMYVFILECEDVDIMYHNKYYKLIRSELCPDHDPGKKRRVCDDTILKELLTDEVINSNHDKLEELGYADCCELAIDLNKLITDRFTNIPSVLYSKISYDEDKDIVEKLMTVDRNSRTILNYTDDKLDICARRDGIHIIFSNEYVQKSYELVIASNSSDEYVGKQLVDKLNQFVEDGHKYIKYLMQ